MEVGRFVGVLVDSWVCLGARMTSRRSVEFTSTVRTRRGFWRAVGREHLLFTIVRKTRSNKQWKLETKLVETRYDM